MLVRFFTNVQIARRPSGLKKETAAFIAAMALCLAHLSKAETTAVLKYFSA